MARISFVILTAMASLVHSAPLDRRDDIVFGANGLAPPRSRSQASSSPSFSTFSSTSVAIRTVISVSTATETDVSVTTLTRTATATQTVVETMTAPPSTITVVMTSQVAAPPPPPPTNQPKSSWALHPHFDDLKTSFGFDKFSWGQDLVSVVDELPLTAFGPSGSPRPGNAIAALYPAGSANPAAAPKGGFGFYASPIDISSASNVSLSYSVFFPADFDFVKGGKLPGLYGGHSGCSGGKESEDCFSARLMWRTEGAGEVYLYAPKGQPSDELCATPPLTYCDTKFGASIGRGSFSFARGEWTDVRQDLWLNTPGESDGGFNLWINGKLALSSSNVYYRHAADSPADNDDDDADADDAPEQPQNKPHGLLDDLGLSGLLPIPIRRRSFIYLDQTTTTTTTTLTATTSAPVQTATTTALVPALLNELLYGHLPPLASPSGLHILATKPVGFAGIMADTFFGGKAKDGYATPRDQTAYFTGFALAVNA